MKLAISEICEKFQSGKNILASNIFDDGMYPVFGGNGLRGYTNTFNQDGEYAIIGRQGAYCGNVKYHKGKAYLTEHAIIALPKSTHNALYLAYKLKFANLAQYQGQSAQPGLSVSTLSKIKLDMPDYSKQKKIADVLSCIDDKIALNNKTNTELENMAKTIYDYWFTQFDFPDKNGHPYKTSGGQMVYNETLKREIPAGWEVGKIDDYCEFITKGTTPSTAGFNFEKSGINFVKVECIENGQILSSNMMYISQEANNALRRSQLKENDILVTIAGRLGSSAVVTKRILPANTNQAVGIIRLNDSYKYMTYYFFQVLESDIVQKQLQGANAQSIQKNLTLPILGDVGILHDPDYSIIKQFASKTKVIFESIEKNIKENEELIKLRDYLLPLLMNGQIEVK